MPFGDDDSACVSPDFDDVAEVVVGVVVRLSVVFLDAFEDTLAAISAPLVADPSSILLVAVVFFFLLDGDLETWRRAVWFSVEIDGYLFRGRWEFIVGEVLVEVVGVVVL